MFCFAFLTGKSLMRQERDFLGETAAALPSCAMAAVTAGTGTLSLRRSLLQASTAGSGQRKHSLKGRVIREELLMMSKGASRSEGLFGPPWFLPCGCLWAYTYLLIYNPCPLPVTCWSCPIELNLFRESAFGVTQMQDQKEGK